MLLIYRYENITLEEIKSKWLGNIKVFKPYHLRSLTGFGRHSTCTLCIATHDIKGYSDCNKCMYGGLLKCNDNENRKTYSDIRDAKTPITLLNAYRRRAKHMRKILEKL